MVEQASNNGGAITTLASKEKNRGGRGEQMRDGFREEKKTAT